MLQAARCPLWEVPEVTRPTMFLCTVEADLSGRRVFVEQLPDALEISADFINAAAKDVVQLTADDYGVPQLTLTFENGIAVYELYSYETDTKMYEGSLKSWTMKETT